MGLVVDRAPCGTKVQAPSVKFHTPVTWEESRRETEAPTPSGTELETGYDTGKSLDTAKKRLEAASVEMDESNIVMKQISARVERHPIEPGEVLWVVAGPNVEGALPAVSHGE